MGRLVIRNGATAEIADAARDRANRRGWLYVGNLELSGNAWLTHPLATPTSEFGLELAITNTLTISKKKPPSAKNPGAGATEPTPASKSEKGEESELKDEPIFSPVKGGG